MSKLDLLLEAERRGILPADKKGLLDEARRRGLVPGGEPQTLMAPIEPAMPSAPGPQMSQSQFDQMAAATKAKDHGGIASTIYRDFIEPWIPNEAPDFSQRGLVERAGDAGSFAASLPVRMVTGGKYGAGDVAEYLGAENTGATLAAGERDFITNNAKQLETVKNAGDLAMGLPAPIPREPPLPVIARRPVAPNVLPRSVRTRLAEGAGGAADDFIMRKMEEGGLTPQDIRRRMAEGQAATKFGKSSGALPENMADLMGDTGQRALRGAVTSPGVASNLAKRALDARQKGTANPYGKQRFGSVGEELASYGQRQRLMDNLSRAFGVRSKGTAFETEAEINNALKSTASPVYTKAWKEAEPFDLRAPLGKIMETAAKYPEGSKPAAALKRAHRLFVMKEGDHYRPLGAADELERFDAAKQALDEMIDGLPKEARNTRRLLNEFRVNLLHAVHGGDRGVPTLNKTYAEARSLYAGPASVKKAIALGRTAFKKSPEVAIGEFSKLGKGEQQGYRLGALEAARLKANGPDGADYTKFFRLPSTAEVLKAIMPEYKASSATKAAPQFGEIVSREANMHQGMNSALYGSKTAPTMEDVKEIGRWAQIAQRLRGQGLVSTVVDEATTELVKMLGMHKDVAERVARMLLHTNPKAIESTLKRLEARYGKAAADEAYFTILNISRNRMRAMLAGNVGSRVIANSEPRR